jgi:hypothetical protein
MPKLERDGESFVLHLNPDDQNRFHPDRLAVVGSAIAEAPALPALRAS